ncbi:MAG: hypothetical protein M4579_005814 [Chaenotheca gracillima]|nr:MAG: hypothetical protein M4579_005814 [Chaenotheca gracillima]
MAMFSLSQAALSLYDIPSPVDTDRQWSQQFEIATEETEKKSLYARDDRAAAREELAKLKEAYDFALNSPEGTEIKNRIGQRLRELEAAIEELNKADFED